MICLIRTVPWNEDRYRWAQELAAQLPGAELVEDTEHDGYITLLDAFRRQGTADAWHFEDDAVLTSNWAGKAKVAELYGSGAIINAFSRTAERSGWRAGASMTYTICFFVPGAWAPRILEYAADPANRAKVERIASGPYDLILGAWMKRHRLRYWQCIPSLVQHRIGPTMIGGSRPDDRSSPNFVP